MRSQRGPRPLGRASLVAVALLVGTGLALTSCSDDGDSGDDPAANALPPQTFRAITGVSMGAYGAMNIGTKFPNDFGVIGSLGGPVDMRELLRHAVRDNLDVRANSVIPSGVGSDFSWDHQPRYPGRETRLSMLKDLSIAFGNPFLHHPDSDAVYLASDSEAATIREDDAFGSFTLTGNPRGFLDSGDPNEDGLRQTMGETPDEVTDVLLLAVGSLPVLTPSPSVITGDRALADLNSDGIFDVGEGIVVNLFEPFDDVDGDLELDTDGSETFQDFGLDGVPGTSDFGEGNGSFDYDPDRANWLAEDPYSRLEGRPTEEIQTQRMYMDVGDADSFEFIDHYLNLRDLLVGKGVPVRTQMGFSGDCFDVPSLTDDHLLLIYPGDHVGIPMVDSIDEVLELDDPCGSAPIWRRILHLIGYLEESFPDGEYGLEGVTTGETDFLMIESPALARPGESPPLREVGVYRPPAFFSTDRPLPVVYLLGGYGQDPRDFEPLGVLLDTLIASQEIQNMIFVYLPGAGGVQGSFYVDHVIPADQSPDSLQNSGRYESSILEDLVPAVESGLLDGRVRAAPLGPAG